MVWISDSIISSTLCWAGQKFFPSKVHTNEHLWDILHKQTPFYAYFIIQQYGEMHPLDEKGNASQKNLYIVSKNKKYSSLRGFPYSCWHCGVSPTVENINFQWCIPIAHHPAYVCRYEVRMRIYFLCKSLLILSRCNLSKPPKAFGGYANY